MNIKKMLALISLLVITAALGACGGGGGSGAAQGKIVIGTQTYSEPKIIAEMYKALIEDRTDVKVDIVTDLAASPIVIQAMSRNEVQMATLYTGEIFNGHFEIEDTKDRAAVLRQAQEGFDKNFGFKWFDPYGFENTYAFAIRKEMADEKGIETVSDLGKYAKDMRIGVDTTWLERGNDGYRAFVEHYGFSFAKAFPMEISLVYEAAASGDVDVVLAYTTDPGIKEFNLKVLADDKQFFPPYDASPVIRKDALERHPELEEVISLLIGQIDAETMTALNYEVDVNKRTPREVALEFLKNRGFLQ